MGKQFLIYGANGYTGELITRFAADRGLKPILAGRNAIAVEELAKKHHLEYRVFSLDETDRLDAALQEVDMVLHCAGPFSITSRPMVEACLRNKKHYTDITGEISVFETCAAMGKKAEEAGVMLMPGCGFDVVPSDCLALHLKNRLPGARRLALAYAGFGRVSRGTATTAIEGLGRGGLVRRGGVLTPVPPAWKTRRIDFGEGPRPAITIPLGDLSSAWHSTGIPDIELYFAAPPALRALAVASRYLGPVLGSAAVRRFLTARVRAGAPGPTEDERRRGRAFVWGEVEDAEGRRAVSRVATPEGYTFTARAALASVDRVLAGQAPAGFQTPAKAYGPDFVLGIPGVTRTDL